MLYELARNWSGIGALWDGEGPGCANWGAKAPLQLAHSTQPVAGNWRGIGANWRKELAQIFAHPRAAHIRRRIVGAAP